ncbi:PadR family transcriptional regulator [Christensenellaceae bacterium OttesenSCG-928-M15]|nr:PadR family transcriptional regulator [Christensenellaceae bacterium OttesenSCG-928-M15]
MIPLYILGLLLRFGPQHGYQIKKLIEEQLADFTQIKLPTIYYHLEKMEAAGLIVSKSEREGARPEKKVYSAGENGAEKFQELLQGTLSMHYRPVFDVDAAFYFSDHLKSEALVKSLESHIGVIKGSLERIEEHRSVTLPYLPGAMRASADVIFEHHAAHYRAELAWAQYAILNMREAEKDAKNENH